jgi:hypothetical protein
MAIGAPEVLLRATAALFEPQRIFGPMSEAWRAKPLMLRWRGLSLPDVELIEVLKQSVEIRDPQDQDDDHYAIQERFDLSLHGDESVHKPQQDARCNNRDEDSGKWHIMYSNLFSKSKPSRHRREVANVRLT